MSTVQRVALAVVALATVTTVLLPGRQTVPVINASGAFVQGTLGTAMGTRTN